MEAFTMRTEKEVRKAIKEIQEHIQIYVSYKENVIAVLNWVLGDKEFDGIGKEK